MTVSPRVTVLMSVHDGAPFVGRAVESILHQTFSDFELLVVNDGSRDMTPQILESYRDPRIRILDNANNVGLTRSLNIGLRAARGKLIARQDADDVSFPERLARQVDAFDEFPEAVLIGAQAYEIDARGRHFDTLEWRKCISPIAIKWQIMFENPFVHTSVMFSRDVVLEEFRGYDESFRSNQDFELWSRMVRRHSSRNLKEALVALRSRTKSISRSYDIAAIRRVRAVFLENRAHILQRAIEQDEGLDIVVAAFFPRTCAAVRDLRPLMKPLHEMIARFDSLHVAASGDPEIRIYRATLLSRIARMTAPDAPAGLWETLKTAREFDTDVFRRAVGAVVVRLLAGKLVRRPHGTATLGSTEQEASSRCLRP